VIPKRRPLIYGEFHDVEMDSNDGSIIVLFALTWFEFDRFYFDRF